MNSPVATTCALIFAKYPEPGAVKTRMVPPLTFAQAAELHEASLLAVCEKVARIGVLRAELIVTPDDSVDRLRALVGEQVEDCRSQGSGDLGQRLTRAIQKSLDDGAAGVIALGADSPTLPDSYLSMAATALKEHDAILGECEDGGYYLIGVSRPLDVLFERIDWGGRRVAAQTRARAADAGVDLHELPPWYDLDRFDDLKRAARDLAEVEADAGPAADDLQRLLLSYIERQTHG